MQYVRKPECWELDVASGLMPGRVYLDENLDPAKDDAPWRVVGEKWRTQGAVCVLHVDDPPTAMPRVFHPRDGVFIAVYGSLEG